MASYVLSLNIADQTAPPLTVTAVSLIALTRSDTGATPTGVTLPSTFALSNGLWQFSFTDPGSIPPFYSYTFTITWSDGSRDTRSSTKPGLISVPNDPTEATVYAYVRDGSGNYVAGYPVQFSLISPPPGVQNLFIGGSIMALSTSAGLAAATLLRGATYSLAGQQFTVPNAPTFQLPTIRV